MVTSEAMMVILSSSPTGKKEFLLFLPFYFIFSGKKEEKRRTQQTSDKKVKGDSINVSTERKTNFVERLTLNKRKKEKKKMRVNTLFAQLK